MNAVTLALLVSRFYTAVSLLLSHFVQHHCNIRTSPISIIFFSTYASPDKLSLAVSVCLWVYISVSTPGNSASCGVDRFRRIVVTDGLWLRHKKNRLTVESDPDQTQDFGYGKPGIAFQRHGLILHRSPTKCIADVWSQAVNLKRYIANYPPTYIRKRSSQ